MLNACGGGSDRSADEVNGFCEPLEVFQAWFTDEYPGYQDSTEAEGYRGNAEATVRYADALDQAAAHAPSDAVADEMRDRAEFSRQASERWRDRAAAPTAAWADGQPPNYRVADPTFAESITAECDLDLSMDDPDSP